MTPTCSIAHLIEGSNLDSPLLVGATKESLLLLQEYHRKVLAVKLLRQQYEEDGAQYERCEATGRIGNWTCCLVHINFSEVGRFEEMELQRRLPHLFPRIGYAHAFSEVWWTTLGFQFPSSKAGWQLTD